MSQSLAKYHNLNRPDEVTDATSYKKHTSKRLSVMLQIKELMMKWNEATQSKGKAVEIMAILVLLIVIAVCFGLIFGNSTSNTEGR